MKRVVLPLAVVVAVLAMTMPCQADTLKGGPTSSAALGVEDSYAGSLPPPGWHLLDYTLYYHAPQLKGEKSREVGTAPWADFETDVVMNIVRPIFVGDAKWLGANPAWHVVVPFVYKHQTTDSMNGTKTGVGDIYFSPLILGWHDAPWHYIAGLDIIAPTGRYSKTGAVTIGNNHWTFEPAFAVSYIGDDWTASAKFMYDVHTTDTSKDYREGDQIHVDFNGGYRFNLDDQADRELLVGLSGYCLRSVRQDEDHGHTIPDSSERVIALGPSVAYNKGPWFVGLKVLKEFEARNRPEGCASWLKVVYSIPSGPRDETKPPATGETIK